MEACGQPSHARTLAGGRAAHPACSRWTQRRRGPGRAAPAPTAPCCSPRRTSSRSARRSRRNAGPAPIGWAARDRRAAHRGRLRRRVPLRPPAGRRHAGARRPGRSSTPARPARAWPPGCGWAGWSLPAGLVDEVAAAAARADRQSSSFDQLTLAEFITSGAYDRQVRRARLAYRRRRDRLVATLRQQAPRRQVTGIAAGLHALLELPPGLDEDEIVARAARRGLAVEGLGPYCAPGHPRGPRWSSATPRHPSTRSPARSPGSARYWPNNTPVYYQADRRISISERQCVALTWENIGHRGQGVMVAGGRYQYFRPGLITRDRARLARIVTAGCAALTAAAAAAAPASAAPRPEPRTRTRAGHCRADAGRPHPARLRAGLAARRDHRRQPRWAALGHPHRVLGARHDQAGPRAARDRTAGWRSTRHGAGLPAAGPPVVEIDCQPPPGPGVRPGRGRLVAARRGRGRASGDGVTPGARHITLNDNYIGLNLAGAASATAAPGCCVAALERQPDRAEPGPAVRRGRATSSPATRALASCWPDPRATPGGQPHRHQPGRHRRHRQPRRRHRPDRRGRATTRSAAPRSWTRPPARPTTRPAARARSRRSSWCRRWAT